MEESSRDPRPVLLSAAQVGGIVIAHAITIASIIAGLGYTERDVGPVPRYWAVVTLGPSLLWAAIVLARAAAWRRASSFWLPGAAAIVAILAFVYAAVLRYGPLDWPGVGFGTLISSWILIGIALIVAAATQLVRRTRARRRA
ncbi:hypothetical protein [Agrococcus beijingensis]|uniref:hypothetical protein n=1 Tax=Agrococcus beijingensis TaxID=3068634 RepID=UPI002740F8FA|nr:hypothetical protein [Agrococcus sp. REN33]